MYNIDILNKEIDMLNKKVTHNGKTYIVRVIEGNKAIAFPLDAHETTIAFHVKSLKVISKVKTGKVEFA